MCRPFYFHLSIVTVAIGSCLEFTWTFWDKWQRLQKFNKMSLFTVKNTLTNKTKKHRCHKHTTIFCYNWCCTHATVEHLLAWPQGHAVLLWSWRLPELVIWFIQPLAGVAQIPFRFLMTRKSVDTSAGASLRNCLIHHDNCWHWRPRFNRVSLMKSIGWVSKGPQELEFCRWHHIESCEQVAFVAEVGLQPVCDHVFDRIWAVWPNPSKVGTQTWTNR